MTHPFYSQPEQVFIYMLIIEIRFRIIRIQIIRMMLVIEIASIIVSRRFLRLLPSENFLRLTRESHIAFVLTLKFELIASCDSKYRRASTSESVRLRGNSNFSQQPDRVRSVRDREFRRLER